MVKYQGLQVGDRALFIPLESGQYAAFDLALNEAAETISSQSSSKIKKSLKEAEYLLDTSCQPKKLKQILDNFAVLAIGTITSLQSEAQADIHYLVACDQQTLQIYQT